MKPALRGPTPLVTLTLSVDVLDGHPDRPVVSALVDGVDPFVEVASGWRGFDPDDLLGSDSPLLPVDPAGRRVAIRLCSCGEPGCGVIAPVIIGSPDRRRVSWVDPRDYTGVFGAPTTDEVEIGEGKQWALPDLHFDREQYVAEVARASVDRSWESPRRAVARLVRNRLTPLGLVLPPDLPLHWVGPGGTGLTVEIWFHRYDRSARPQFREQRLRLASGRGDPDGAAQDVVDQLLSTAPADWTNRFGRRA